MADTYKCPGCGSALLFDAKEQKMKCASCSNSYEVKDIEQYYRIDERLASNARMSWESPVSGSWSEDERAHLRAYHCPSCGSEVVVEDTAAATECVYCQNPLVMEDAYQGEYKPEAVIPFKLSLEEAKNRYAAYLKGKKLLPDRFAKQNRIERITGVYVPFWLFNCDTDSDLSYKCTKVRTYRSGNYMVTETSHYRVMRGGGLGFDNVPVDGSRSMADNLMEAIEPFDTQLQEDFAMTYLSGYQAQRHDVPAEQCKERANERIRASVLQRFRETVKGYATVVPETQSVRISDGNVREVLMPVWMLNTKYKNKTYTFAMNGQTGRFIGDLPVSFGKACAWFFSVALGVTAAASAVCYFLANAGVI